MPIFVDFCLTCAPTEKELLYNLECKSKVEREKCYDLVNHINNFNCMWRIDLV